MDVPCQMAIYPGGLCVDLSNQYELHGANDTGSDDLIAKMQTKMFVSLEDHAVAGCGFK